MKIKAEIVHNINMYDSIILELDDDDIQEFESLKDDDINFFLLEVAYDYVNSNRYDYYRKIKQLVNDENYDTEYSEPIHCEIIKE